MNVLERLQHEPAPTIHWLVRSVMWLLVALCVALPLLIVLAPFFLRPAASAPPDTAWTVLELAGGICGACVFGAGFLGTLAWRGHSSIQGVVWRGNHPVAPRLPWYTRAWAGVVCVGVSMLLVVQLHRAAWGDASWLSTFMTLVMVGVTFRYLSSPLLTGRWSEATVRFAPRLTMTPREMHAAAKGEHGRPPDA